MKETITLKIADLDNIIINALNKVYQCKQGQIAVQVRDDLIDNDIDKLLYICEK